MDLMAETIKPETKEAHELGEGDGAPLTKRDELPIEERMQEDIHDLQRRLEELKISQQRGQIALQQLTAYLSDAGVVPLIGVNNQQSPRSKAYAWSSFSSSPS